MLPAFTCARAIGNLSSICFGVNILSLELSVSDIPDPVDSFRNILLLKALRIASLPS